MSRSKIIAIIVSLAVLSGVGFLAWSAMRPAKSGVSAVTSPTPSTSPTPTPEPRETLSDPRGYTATHPAGWDISVFEGDVQIRPAGLPSIEQGEDTFSVSIQVEAGANDPVACSGEDIPNPGTEGSTTINGETVPTCDQIGNDGDDWYRRTYTFAWKGHTCDHVSLGCPSRKAGLTVTVRVVAAKKALWDRYLEDGVSIAESLRRSEPRPDEDFNETINS